MADVAYGSNFAGSGAGKTILLHKEVEKVGWADRLGYPAQKCGDCVSHGTAKAMGYTLCVGITHGNGSKPETNGVENTMFPIASETHYWHRGKSSDGWHASASLRVAKEKTGIVIRQKIPGGAGLTHYSRETAHRFGRTPPPQSVNDFLDDNPILTFSKCNSFEEIRDAIANGFGVQTDGGEGFAKSVNSDGVARRSGSWSHSMSVSGVIDTEAFKSKYGCPGLLIQNSWGNFNHVTNEKVFGTNVALPKGSFIAKWNDVKRRSYYAVSNITSWPARDLPDWSMRDLI